MRNAYGANVWLIKTWSKLPRSEYAIIVPILVIMGEFDFLNGMAEGLLVAIVLFVINYSRIDVVPSSSVTTDAEATDFRLSSENLARMEHDAPEIAVVFHRFMAEFSADRQLRDTRTLEGIAEYRLLNKHRPGPKPETSHQAPSPRPMGERDSGPRKKIIIQSCRSFGPASALRKGLHIPICAPFRALNLDQNPRHHLDDYLCPRP